MNSIFQLLICLSLIVLRTVLIPAIPLLDPFYDIVIVYVVFAGLTRPLLQGSCLVVVAGGLMDSVSGGGFGVFLVTYLWLFAGVRCLTRFMHAGSFVLLTIVLLAGVVLENMIQLSILLAGGGIAAPDVAATVVTELVWVFVTGHFVFMFLERINVIWDRVASKWSEKIKE